MINALPPLGDHYYNYFLLANKNIIYIDFIDTAGQEYYWSLNFTYVPHSDIIFLIYNISNFDSFRDCTILINKIKNFIKNNQKVFILGNKYLEERKVSFEEGKNLAEKHGFIFTEISTSENKNIKEVVEISVGIALENKKNLKINSCFIF